MTRGRERLAILAHPVFLGAVLLLAVNDHLLKDRWPGLVTGKLSDVAGVLLVAVLLFALTGSRVTAVGLTIVGFGALKTIPDLTEWTAHTLGLATRPDESDLAALIVLIPCWWWFGRGGLARAGEARRLLGLCVGAMASLAILATPCPATPKVVGFSEAGDGRVIAGVRNLYEGIDEWAASDDGIRWRQVPTPDDARIVEHRTACLPHRCFRVVPGEGVDERERGGAWRTAFRFTGEQDRRRNLRGGDGCAGAVDPFNAVVVVGAGASRRVVVGMGADGVLVRDPEGRWRRHAVLGAEPARLDGSSWFAYLPLVVVALALVIGAVGVAPVFAAVGVLLFLGADYTIWGPGSLLGSGVVVLLGIALGQYSGWRRRRRRRSTEPPARATWSR